MRRTSSTVFAAGIVALVGLTGCPDREVSEVDPSQDRVELKDIPLTINRDIDILFVIDNSKSMKEEQDNLRANFPQFINVLQQIQGGLPNVHIGVVTSDTGTLNVNTGDAACNATGGDNGNLQTNACAGITGNFISDILVDPMTGMRMTNYSGALADVFSCLAAVGDTGCGFEQHLDSMKRALNNNPVNANFLRANAFLAVIFIADEDDCSATNPQFFGPESPALGPLDSFRCFEKGINCTEGTDTQLRDVGVKTGCVSNEGSTYLAHVADMVTFLKGVKNDDDDIIVAGIIGNSEPVEVGRRVPMGGGAERPDLLPSCTYVDTGTGMPNYADPGIRLKAFLESFPNRNTSTTICDADLTDGLVQIAELLRDVIGYPCIEANLLDTDPDTAGLQPDCQFSLVNDAGVETVLPECTGSNEPCYALELDTTNCMGTPTQLAVVYHGPTQTGDSNIKGGCVVVAD